MGLAVTSQLIACVSADRPSHDLSITCKNRADTPIDVLESKVSGLSLRGSYVSDSPFDSSAAEIVSYDQCSDRLYVVNAHAKHVDVIGFDDKGAPTGSGSLDLSVAATSAGIEIGAANSVSTFDGLLAVAIENKIKQQPGIIALFRTDTLELLTTYPTGALPDMVSFSPDGLILATANEGEPNGEYTVDPEGSVTLVDIRDGVNNPTVHQITFTEFNQGQARHHQLSSKVRVSAHSKTVAQDFEPEYLTFDNKGQLFVALQENNAIAVIDVDTASIKSVLGLGAKHWSAHTLDASNKDGVIGNLMPYQGLESLYMPDSIDAFSMDNVSYFVSANEGDGREYGIKTTQAQCDSKGFKWDGDDYTGSPDYTQEVDFCISYTDEVRGKKLDVPDDHPLASQLKDGAKLGRIKLIKPDNPLQADDPITGFGGRSFSIWNEQGELVFDSADEFAKIVLNAETEHFNSSNDNNDSADDRSDDKGVEPEAIEVAMIGNRTYAFIGLERQGGIMVYDITTPKAAQFITYVNNRNFDQPVCTQVDDGDCDNDTYNPQAGDLGPESIHYYTRNGVHYIAVGNEVSGTTSVFELLF
nr:choice-of-anchor I family protein [Vibrio sp. JPW-9-11-11]